MLGSLIAPLLMTGKKPVVPDFQAVNLGEEQRKATASNIANFDAASQLAAKVNRFNQSEILAMLEMAAPGFGEVQSAQRGLVMDELAGKLPKDVQDLIQSKSASRAVQGGFSGSGMGRNLVARDLGLASLDLTSRGFAHADQWLARAQSFTARPFDASAMFISPMQQASVTQANNAAQYNTAWLRNQIAAQPDPLAAAYGQALLNIESQTMGLASSVGGALAGGALGGMGGFGGGGTPQARPDVTPGGQPVTGGWSNPTGMWG